MRVMSKSWQQLLLVAAISTTALSAALIPAAYARDAESHYAIVQRTLDTHVLPHFAALEATAAKLPDAVEQVCKTGADGSREELLSDFRNTVLAYAGVAYLRFGPLIEGSRRERLSFWPDPRGIMNRQLRQLLAATDTAVLDAIQKQSAAVQGLPALEALITDIEVPLGPAEAAAYRCKLASAIARNIVQLTSEINADWTKSGGWKDKMLRPGSDNDAYKEPRDAASELVKALLTGFQLIATTEIEPQVLKKRGFDGPYTRSNLPKLYFRAGIDSLDAYYQAMALEAFLDDDKDWVKNWTGGAWRTLRESDGAGGVVSGVPKTFAPPVRKVFDMLIQMRRIVVGEISAAAALAVGFNELDGD